MNKPKALLILIAVVFTWANILSSISYGGQWVGKVMQHEDGTYTPIVCEGDDCTLGVFGGATGDGPFGRFRSKKKAQKKADEQAERNNNPDGDSYTGEGDCPLGTDC